MQWGENFKMNCFLFWYCFRMGILMSGMSMLGRDWTVERAGCVSEVFLTVAGSFFLGGQKKSTSLGTAWLWSQPVGMTERGMILGSYRRDQPQREPWIDINGLLCLLIFARSLLGINTVLIKQRVLLPFPTSPALCLACANKGVPLPSSAGTYYPYFMASSSRSTAAFSWHRPSNSPGKSSQYNPLLP